MAARIRLWVDRSLRWASVAFSLFAFIYYAPTTWHAIGWIGATTFLGLACITYFLSKLLVPLLVMTNFRRRTGDPGSFVLDAAIYAFAFAILGAYAAALLHLVTTSSLHNMRMKYSVWERLLRAAPGVPFWFLFGYVRDLFHGSYEAYSFSGLAWFVLLIMAAHAAYVFLWFDIFFSLRTGQRITEFWKAQAQDWITWALVFAQTLWGYASAQMYLDGKPLLAVSSFVPLIAFAFLLRREHRGSVEMYRMESAGRAMDAVLRKQDPRPFLRELLQSALSAFFNEDLAIFTRTPGSLDFAPVAQSSGFAAAQERLHAIQACLWRCAADPGCYAEVGGDGNWAAYPIYIRAEYYGALVVVRHKEIGDPIRRSELRTLADDVAPVIANLNEIVATQDAANVDGLTGLLNRKGLELQIVRVFSAPVVPRCVALMLDVDHFKLVNDTQGHAQGDSVLRRIAAVIGENCRQHDVVGRYGGEEFLLVLSDVSLDSALTIAERVRAAINERASVTVSVGLTEYQPPEAPESLIDRADSALYAAKNAGRNRCVTI